MTSIAWYNREPYSARKETIQQKLPNRISLCNSKTLKDASIVYSTRLPKQIAMAPKLKIAAIQAEPAWQDLEGGVNKSIALIEEAASKGANVVGFPEVFIPGYPW